MSVCTKLNIIFTCRNAAIIYIYICDIEKYKFIDMVAMHWSGLTRGFTDLKKIAEVKHNQASMTCNYTAAACCTPVVQPQSKL